MSERAVSTVSTAWGQLAIAFDERGVVAVELPHARPGDAVAALAARGFDHAEPTTDARPPWLARAEEALAAYFRDASTDLRPIPLGLAPASTFAERVRERLRAVEPGATITYGALAGAAGSPAAARAVGRLMATNPVPLLVPCHRVLANGGALGGFSAAGGAATKARLLTHEGSLMATPRTTVRDSSAMTAAPGDAAAHLAAVDRRLGRAIARIGPCRLTADTRSSPFSALVEAIVHQQLATRAAATITRRLREALRPLTPERVLRAPERVLRDAGLSQAKARAVRELAERARRGGLPSRHALADMSDEDVIASLTESRGIGRWTAEMFLIFRLGRPDVLSGGDLGLRKGFSRLVGGEFAPLASAEAMLRYGARWSPFRSVASWYLWRLAESDS